MMQYNFHTHSHYDDGKEGLEDFVLEAIRLGFDALGFSGHSPLPVNNEWSIPKEKLPSYIAEAKSLKEKYKSKIRLFLGLEIDFIPGMSENFDELIKGIPLDYCIGSVHLVKHPQSGKIWFIDGPAEGYFQGIDELFEGNAREAVTAFYRQSIRMVETQPMNIIGHLDKVKMHNKEQRFSTDEPWYQELIDQLLDAIASRQVIVELNTRGVYTGKTEEYFPSEVILKKCLQRQIPVMVNTDAHHPSQLNKHFWEGAELLKRMGFGSTLIHPVLSHVK
jgi:histidinol-phosphatase (PHP family)